MKLLNSKSDFQKAQKQQTKQYAAFWKWFNKHQKTFYNILKHEDSKGIDKNFFDPLMQKLTEIRDGYYFLAGIDGNDIAELIFTADGEITNIPFMEDLVAAAPEIHGWRFIASKPESDLNCTTINMEGYTFTLENLYFYATASPDSPDSICITVIHNDYTDTPSVANKIIQGVYLFLDNYLGEVKSVTVIDSVSVQGPSKAEKDLIPIDKLKSYLEWRQKEFVEKYENVRYNEENDCYASLKAQSENGNPVMIMVNTGAMDWDRAASHPWILKVNIKYDGSHNEGLPTSETNKFMDLIEDQLIELIPIKDGHIYLGRETYEGNRYIYFACHDFRQSSRVTEFIINQYSDQLEIERNIYKDLYRRSLSTFKSENWVESEDEEENE